MALEPTGLLVVRPWDVTPSKAQGVGCPKRPSGRLKEVPPPHHCVKLEGLSQGRFFFVMEDFQDKGLRVHDLLQEFPSHRCSWPLWSVAYLQQEVGSSISLSGFSRSIARVPHWLCVGLWGRESESSSSLPQSSPSMQKMSCCTWVSKRIFHDFQKAISSSPPKFYTQHFSTRSHFACANDGCPFGPFFLRHRWEWPENLQIQSFSWKLMDLRTTNLER